MVMDWKKETGEEMVSESRRPSPPRRTLLGAPGIATRNKDATNGAPVFSALEPGLRSKNTDEGWTSSTSWHRDKRVGDRRTNVARAAGRHIGLGITCAVTSWTCWTENAERVTGRRAGDGDHSCRCDSGVPTGQPVITEASGGSAWQEQVHCQPLGLPKQQQQITVAVSAASKPENL